jgi:hypothetical protein
VPDLKFLYQEYSDYGDNETKKKAFHWFAHTILPCVSARTKNFVRRRGIETISSVMTVSDEAFALVTLKNYEGRWRSQAEVEHLEDLEERKKKWEHGLYTSGGIGPKLNKGWSNEGIRKYNEYCGMIRGQRENEDSWKLVEMDFLEYCQEMEGHVGGKTGDLEVTQLGISDNEEEVAYSDWN